MFTEADNIMKICKQYYFWNLPVINVTLLIRDFYSHRTRCKITSCSQGLFSTGLFNCEHSFLRPNSNSCLYKTSEGSCTTLIFNNED